MAKVCIICEKETDGFLVLDDYVIRFIRSVKNALGIAKNNTLVVCSNCLEEYKKKRAKYERDLAIHAVVGGLVLLIMVFLPLFTSGFSITAVFFGLLLFGMIMALSVFSHCPKIEEKPEPKKKGKK
ncbi:MAG: hypothetical protein QXT25_02930 [Candidatus Anstonellaceae archaeon]